jgi:hypothetical protein
VLAVLERGLAVDLEAVIVNELLANAFTYACPPAVRNGGRIGLELVR